MTAQADALMEVAAGTSDAAVIDLLMATAMIGEGTNYADLAYTVRLSEEEYGVGFRKGSDLAKALNDFFAECYVIHVRYLPTLELLIYHTSDICKISFIRSL